MSNKGKPLDPHLIKRINELWYKSGMRSKTDIARRLDISVYAVRKHLKTEEEWERSKTE